MNQKKLKYELYKPFKSSKKFHKLMLDNYSLFEKNNKIDCIYLKRDLEKLINTFEDFIDDVNYYKEKL